MQRAPIVLSSTVAGVVGILAVHTVAPSTASSLKASTAAATTASTPAAGSTTTAGPTTASTTTTAATSTAASTSATRTVTGQDVNDQYGDLEVKVTATGRRITNISLVRLDVSDPHSQEIDQYAIPQLRAQAIAAQSAKINGVSGASYTSAAYAQSLQAALDKLA